MQYHFTYWPIAFRGNFVRNLFAYTNTEYLEVYATEQIIALKSQAVGAQPCPFMGPPLLEDKATNVALSQMTAIVFYLGEQFELLPVDLADRAMTLKVLGDCTDVLSEMTRDNGNQMWDQLSWDEFMATRFAQWLKIFEEATSRNTSDGNDYLFGQTSAGVADLAYHALLATMERCLPQLSPTLRRHAPATMAICDCVSANDGIKVLVAKQSAEQGQVYCGGEIEKSIRAVLAN